MTLRFARLFEKAPRSDDAPTPTRWPSEIDKIPLFLTQKELAHLLGRSVRTLERDRGTGGRIPFKKIGRSVLYSREDVLQFLDEASFQNTREAKAMRAL
jgi:Helix-turn-helix domain